LIEGYIRHFTLNLDNGTESGGPSCSTQADQQAAQGNAAIDENSHRNQVRVVLSMLAKPTGTTA
jgi:hypothetical protein